MAWTLTLFVVGVLLGWFVGAALNLLEVVVLAFVLIVLACYLEGRRPWN